VAAGVNGEIKCPNPRCGKLLKTGGAPAGSRIKCPFCSEEITVPAYGQSTVKLHPAGRGRGPSPGSEFGPFDIIEKVGEGGMGAVYKARNLKLDRIVALKIISPHLAAGSPDALARFLREARSAARLDHPNIVTVHSVGETAGCHYIEMQFVEGRSLADELAGHGRIPVGEALRILRGVALALQAAHRKGIVHRDIKPQNIMLAEDGRVLVTDFGLARGAEMSEITGPGQVLGTPHYMSPEQCEGKRVDARSDIYSLGATAFRMLTGRTLFSGDTPLVVMRMHTDTPPPDPKEVRSDIPADVAALINKMLRKDPAERYRDCAELLADLDRIEGKAARPGAMRYVLPAIVVAALTVVGVVALFLFRPNPELTDDGTFPTAAARQAIASLVAERRRALSPKLITVAKSGADYDNLSDALVAAGRGDVVEITDSGTYAETLVIAAPEVFVRARPGCCPCIDAGRARSRCVEVADTAAGAVIQGLTCVGATSEGILVQPGARGVIIFDNACARNRWGIKVQATDAVVAANEVHDNQSYGIQILQAANAKVVDNVSFRNSSGFHVKGCSDVLLCNNIAYSNRSSGIACEESKSVRVFSNICWDCRENGLSVEGASEVTAKLNIISRCGRAGIALDAAAVLKSDDNAIYDCRYAGARGANKFPTLAEWARATGLDANSLDVEPGFIGPPADFRLSRESACRTAGMGPAWDGSGLSARPR